MFQVTPIVLACIIHDDKVIFNTDTWDFPGGLVQVNESLEQALETRIQEQLGIDIRIYNVVGSIIKSHGSTDLILIYYCIPFRFLIEEKLREGYKLATLREIENRPLIPSKYHITYDIVKEAIHKHYASGNYVYNTGIHTNVQKISSEESVLITIINNRHGECTYTEVFQNGKLTSELIDNSRTNAQKYFDIKNKTNVFNKEDS